MIRSDTLPVPVQRTPLSAPLKPIHEHAWSVESRHATSEGVVVYVCCADCGARRVDMQTRGHMPPAALSAEIAAANR